MLRQPSIRPVLSLPHRMQADTSAKGRGITIAMIDSDFVQHPDICSPEQRVVQYVDAVEQTTHPELPSQAIARHWHGTMTACTAAGNGFMSHGQYSSLAPLARLVAIRAMNHDGRITTPTIVWALRWIEQHVEELHIDVVNISVYADETDQTLQHPVNAAVEDLVRRGIVVVAAAGNNPNAPIRPPAAAPSAITVGGLNDNNTLDRADDIMYHSSFGRTSLNVQKPEIIAPSIWLPAPVLPGTIGAQQAAALCALDCMDDHQLMNQGLAIAREVGLLPEADAPTDLYSLRGIISDAIREHVLINPWYKMVDGTSFAAPIVTSVIAQILEVAPYLTPFDVKDILMATAKQLVGVDGLCQGAGVVNQPTALSMARGYSKSAKSAVERI
ncbi:MAG: serine protease [Ignavibacteria bacterium]|nr:serine protease [Ignavibacteria bacterium]